MGSCLPPRAVGSHELFIGAKLLWAHVPRGGYGYTIYVPAEVVALSLDGTRAKIAVRTKTGESRVRSVKSEDLRWRGTTMPEVRRG